MHNKNATHHERGRVWGLIKLPSKSSNDKSSTGNIAWIYHPNPSWQSSPGLPYFYLEIPIKSLICHLPRHPGLVSKSKKYVPENERLEPKNHPVEKLKSNIIFVIFSRVQPPNFQSSTWKTPSPKFSSPPGQLARKSAKKDAPWDLNLDLATCLFFEAFQEIPERKRIDTKQKFSMFKKESPLFQTIFLGCPSSSHVEY